MATKHEQILQHISSLPVGAKISVRTIARLLQVSEGTAYRAIKDAEMQGLVSAMDRIGTVRIEQKQKNEIHRLTFAEVVNIVEGTVLGGRDGLHKTLQKFVIGAMREEAMVRYIEPDSLMIVGNREEVQRISLEHGAAVLITGGFEASDDIQRLANQKQLPLLSCSYDTFTTASLINRAIYDRLIKKDILFVGDVMSANPLMVMVPKQTVRDYYALVEETGHTRFPVVDENYRLIGIVTSRDVAEANRDALVEQHMVRQPVSVSSKSTVASAAHRMVWEGIEMMPVVQSRRLVGVISRQDVIKALQLMNRQPQVADTLQDQVLQGFVEVQGEDKSVSLVGDVTPQLTTAGGVLATGSLTTLMEACVVLCMQRMRNVDLALENVTLYFLKPISVDSRIEVRATVLDFGRRFAKADVLVLDGADIAAKAMLTMQVLER